MMDISLVPLGQKVSSLPGAPSKPSHSFAESLINGIEHTPLFLPEATDSQMPISLSDERVLSVDPLASASRKCVLQGAESMLSLMASSWLDRRPIQ